jgi:hypothetical protein
MTANALGNLSIKTIIFDFVPALTELFFYAFYIGAGLGIDPDHIVSIHK